MQMRRTREDIDHLADSGERIIELHCHTEIGVNDVSQSNESVAPVVEVSTTDARNVIVTPRSKMSSPLNQLRQRIKSTSAPGTPKAIGFSAKTKRESQTLDQTKNLHSSSTIKKKIVSSGGDDMTSIKNHQRLHRNKFGATLRRETILSHRHYKAVCISTIIVFIGLHLLLGLNQYFAEHPLCPYEAPGSPWIRDINIFTAGGLIFSMLLQMNRIQLSTFREHNDIGTMSSYFASLCVNFIAGISHISIIFWDWGGNCKDAYGIITPAAMWPEWLMAVPLMLFISVSVDDKPYLSVQDIFVIASNFLMIVFGCALQLTSSRTVGAICFIASSICCLSVYYLLFQAREEMQYCMDQFQAQSKQTPPSAESQRKLLLTSRKVTLITCIAASFPAFPAAYLLRLCNYFDDNMLFAAFLMLSAGTKVIYASLCMDAHLEVSHPAIGLIDTEKFSSTSRRAFIRYVFHEVRVPLNSIALGIQILANHGLSTDTNADSKQVSIIETDNHPSYDKTQLDTLSMIRDAVNFMGDTLNDVMALQKVEEGSLELILRPFSIFDLFQNIEDTFLEISSTSDVSLETVIDQNMPTLLIGDKFRIRHVICNLVSNAMKYSKPGSVVKLTVQSEGNIERPRDILPKSIVAPNSRRGKKHGTGTSHHSGGLKNGKSPADSVRIIRSQLHQQQHHRNSHKTKYKASYRTSTNSSDSSPRSDSANPDMKIRGVEHEQEDIDADIDEEEYEDQYQKHDMAAKFIKFQVSDKGKGIPKDIANDIFSPFHRLKDGELTEGRGSGLGLAICREIVHMHGGQISFVSVVDEGTTFTVVLPLEVVNESELNSTFSSALTNSKDSKRTNQPLSGHGIVRSVSSGSLEGNAAYSPLSPMPGMGMGSPQLRRRRNNGKRIVKGGIGLDNEVTPSLLQYPSLSSMMTSSTSEHEESRISSSSSSRPSLTPLKRSHSAVVPAVVSSLVAATNSQGSPLPSKNKTESCNVSIQNDDKSNNIHRKMYCSPAMSTTVPTNHSSIFVNELDSSNHGEISGEESMNLLVSATSNMTKDQETAMEVKRLLLCKSETNSDKSGNAETSPKKQPESSITLPMSPTCSDDKSLLSECSHQLSLKASADGSKDICENEESDLDTGSRNNQAADKFEIIAIESRPCCNTTANESMSDTTRIPLNSTQHVTSDTVSSLIPDSRENANKQIVEVKSDVTNLIKTMRIEIPTLPTYQYQSPVKNAVVPLSTSSFPSTSIGSCGYSNSALKTQDLSNLQVLIVDDVMSNRKLLAMLLKQKGIQSVDFAEDGVKALNCIESKGPAHYDIIFMDNTMPNMTGLEATQILRKKAFPHLIIGVTGNAMEDELLDFAEGGADIVLSKPMRMNMLDMILSFLLKNGPKSNFSLNQRMVVDDKEIQWKSFSHCHHEDKLLHRRSPVVYI